MKPQKLPIGIQTFKTIREDGYLYVDKTKAIYDLITTNSIYFISRPRRFGKSLLISTLKEIYEGNKELFQGLYIYNTDFAWTTHPIIRLDFSGFNKRSKEGLEKSVKNKLSEIALKYKIKINDNLLITDYFKSLISKLSKINKVVVLIDEYDAPIIANMGKDNELAIELREFLKDFYTILKSEDEYLKFVLLTGVSKFSKAGVFSGLNQLQDITIDTRFADLLGWTQEELEKYFSAEIKNLAKKENLNSKEIIQKIKYWYNGYQFSDDLNKKVYNPFSTLLLFQKQKFYFHWFESGTPTFLINLLKEKKYNLAELENLELNATAFSAYEIEDLNPLSLLFQSGYLTIKNYEDTSRLYTLGYPNYEVKNAFLDNLSRVYVEPQIGLASYTYRFINYLKSNDLNGFFDLLRTLFANVPYDIHLKNEKYYQTIFYLIFALIGLEQNIDCEIKTNIGRIDAVIQIADQIYIFEFKLNGTKEEALAQIKEKKYFEKYLESARTGRGLFMHKSKNSKKIIYLVGVEFRFDENERNIGEWIVEQS